MKEKIVKETIEVDGVSIQMYTEDFKNDYISLTDIARKREGEYPGYVIQNWMRAKSTISFIGLWERLHNDDFNCLEFEAIKNEAGENDFVMTPNCIMNTSRRTKLLEPHTTLFHRNFHNTQRSSQIVDGLPPNINPLIKGNLT